MRGGFLTRFCGVETSVIMAELDAPTLIAKCLKQQGIRFIFGIVGIPVTRTACEAQNYGIQFVGMRNEQAASFAAGAIGYLTQYPAVCLTVAGPGMVNAIPGLLNAKANCWPMILLSASSEAEQQGMGAFQESVQLEAARPYTKFCARIEKLLYFPNLLVQAIRHATYGRPGPVYLEVTANVFTETVSEKQITFPVCCPPPPQAAAPAQAIRDAIALLKNATRPLVIIGKGAAYACAEIELRRFIETTRFPFLPSPMGKGVIPDDHTFCVSAARSSALKDAETILLVGARLNWMFHFGQPPKFNSNVKIIQIDICPEEFHCNKDISVALCGDIKNVMQQINAEMKTNSIAFSLDSEWWCSLTKVIEKNKQELAKKVAKETIPLNYYYVLKQIQDSLPRDAVIVSEGANTLDIGRMIIQNYQPRSRLDSGTLGTMGVGMAYAIAAALVYPNRKIVAIEGDSAFGFSGMEVEVICRYRLPVTVFILNNNGIYSGIEKIEDTRRIPPTALLPNAHYEKIMEAFGGRGYCVATPDDLRRVLLEWKNTHDSIPTLVNVIIDPHSPTPTNVAQQQAKEHRTN